MQIPDLLISTDQVSHLHCLFSQIWKWFALLGPSIIPCVIIALSAILDTPSSSRLFSLIISEYFSIPVTVAPFPLPLQADCLKEYSLAYLKSVMKLCRWLSRLWSCSNGKKNKPAKILQIHIYSLPRESSVVVLSCASTSAANFQQSSFSLDLESFICSTLPLALFIVPACDSWEL